MKKLILTALFFIFTVTLSFAGNPASYPLFQAIDADGNPVSGGFVYTYEPGTTTNKTAYTDKELSVPATNPIVLDSKGESKFYLFGEYKINLKDSAGVQVDGWPIDNIRGIDSGLSDDYYAPDYTLVDQGALEVGSLKYYIDTIGSDQATIVLRHNSGSATTTYTLTTSETIPANITLRVERGAVIDGAGTLTVEGGSNFSSSGQCFGSSITVLGLKKYIPQSWGAKGDYDGATGTDDTLPIQAAINNAELSGEVFNSRTNSWPTVFFPDGGYLTTGVTVSKAITLKGEDKTSSFLKTTTDAALIEIDLTYGDQVDYAGPVIKDIGLFGNIIGSSQDGILIGSAASVYEIKNCNIANFGNHGINFQGGAELRVTESWIEYNQNAGINVQGAFLSGTPAGYANGIWIKDNIIRLNKIGINLYAKIVALTIENNIIENNTAGSGDFGSTTRPSIGIKMVQDPAGTVYFGVQGSTIKENYIEYHYQDIYIEALTSSIIKENYIDGNQGMWGVYAFDSSAGQYGPIVFDSTKASFNNTIKNNSVTVKGVEIPTGDWFVVDGTTIDITAATNLSTLVRYKNGAYIYCDTVDKIATISDAVFAGGKITLTVSSTTSFSNAQTIAVFVPQVSGLNGSPYRNRVINNTFDTLLTYVDPEGVYDGQCIPIGLRGQRGGMQANIPGTTSYNRYAEKMAIKTLTGTFKPDVIYNDMGFNLFTPGATTLKDLGGADLVNSQWTVLAHDVATTTSYASGLIFVNSAGNAMTVYNIVKAGTLATSGFTASGTNLQITLDGAVDKSLAWSIIRTR